MPVLSFLFADLTPAAAVCLAVCGWASGAAFLYVTCDADVKSVWQAAIHTGHDLNWALASAQHHAREFARDAWSFACLSLRDAAFTATALLAFLTITPGDAR